MAEHISLEAEDGHRFDAYLAQPDGPAKAGLVVIQEIFGVNGHIQGVADGYARDGYLVAAPALFDRVERGVALGYGPEDITRGRALRGEIPWDQAAMDVAAAAEAVRSAGKAGVVGYCWGGSVTWLAACRGGFAAAVGYYGGQIHDLKGERPTCPAMLHFGERDTHIPPEMVAGIASAHPDVEIHNYPAGHGFNCDQRGDYDPDCAREARQRSIAFLDRHLT